MPAAFLALLAGITNLVSCVGVADIPGFIGSYFGGEFWDALALWQDRSAVLHVKAVTTPTLIQHGENDLRVPSRRATSSTRRSSGGTCRSRWSCTLARGTASASRGSSST
jgi:dipeptidyl aminopeptidase/acylaminoacyl peptidase